MKMCTKCIVLVNKWTVSIYSPDITAIKVVII